ncbi:MAG: hypothetical protein C5B60_06895 [Chloroflexi bacterium]|nr:MAG: hypothetical protein C5B60_06895 [Chloroflexota bacterium]
MAWFDPKIALSGPINLAQAKQVKIDMVDTIYEEKRAQWRPYGLYEYEGTDEAIRYMAAAVATMRLIGNMAEDALAVIVQHLNTNVGIDDGNRWPINGMINRWNSVGITDSEGGGWQDLGPNTTVVPGVPNPPPMAPTPPQTFSHTHSYHDTAYRTTLNITLYDISGALTDQNLILGGGGNVTPAPVNWQPLNTSSRIDIPFTSFAAALQAFVSRYTNLTTARQRHRREIAECMSIDDVVAHDVTAGWPP